MPEITDYRITGLKTSIHSLRLRMGFLWNYLNKQNRAKLETDGLTKKNINKGLSPKKSDLDKKTNLLNKKHKNNSLEEKKSISK